MYATKVLNHSSKKKQFNKLLFYCVLIAIPTIQFLVFYVYVNIGSILMAFRSYQVLEGALVYTYSADALASNFNSAWNALTSHTMELRNSGFFFLFTLLINIPLALLSSYYLYKKKHASGFFKVMLFMPQILSCVILSVLYRYIIDSVFFVASGERGVFLYDLNKLFGTLGFNLIMSFGVNVLIYTSAMSAINDSLIESAQLDGCSSWQEFIHIVIPMIYPTIVTLLVVFISYFFVDQYQVFVLYDVGGATVGNIGYYLYRQNLETSLIGDSASNLLSYPALAAFGLILTAIILPITLFSRWALNKFGPSAE